MKKEPKNPYEKKLKDAMRPGKRATQKAEEKKAETILYISTMPSFPVQVTTGSYCNYCGQGSHSSGNCPYYFNTISQVTCKVCGQSDHSTGHCPYGAWGLYTCIHCGGSHTSSMCSYYQQMRLTQGQFMSWASSMASFNFSHQPDPSIPTTLGWRGWIWDEFTEKLFSPVFGVPWDAAECRADLFDPVKDIRGKQGIHAYLVPENWKEKTCETITYVMNGCQTERLFRVEYTQPSTYKSLLGYPSTINLASAKHFHELKPLPVHGIVERFGQFQVGEIGWRSEWAVIRELLAPDEAIGLKLERMFPEVKVHFPEEPRKPEELNAPFDFKF